MSNVALVVGDVAAPATTGDEPTDTPPTEHVPPFAVTVAGSHKKNSAVPVGAGAGATVATVILSSTVVPGITPDPVGLETVSISTSVLKSCFSVVKHSDESLV